MTSHNFEELKQKFIIKDNLYDFNVMSNFIPKFFELLWENPKIVSDMIIHCNLPKLNEKLAKFFMNNFYENILSGNSIENNLIYVLTLLIKDEIDKLNNIEDCDKFLDNDSKVGYLLSELRKKKDIKNFFKIIIPNLISDLESISLIKLCLNFREMFDKLLPAFISTEYKKPVVFEVFTDADQDGEIGRSIMGAYRDALNNSFEDQAKKKILQVLGGENVQKIRGILKK